MAARKAAKSKPVRLEQLTPEQEAQLPASRDEWLAVGLSTAPADRPAAEAGVRLAYERAGLPAPRVMLWCDSPLSGALTLAILQNTQAMESVRDSVRDRVGESVWESVRESVGASVWASVWESVRESVGESVRESVGESVGASVWASVWESVQESVGASVWASVRASVRESVGASVWASVQESVGASVWASVRASVRESVGASVWASVWESVRESVGESVRESVGESVWASVHKFLWDTLWGQHDAPWLSFYDTFGRFGLDVGAIAGLSAVARAAGWWWAYQDMALLTERPCVLRRDAQGRIHAGDGPAIAYPDGFAIYAWHGVRVPEAVITAPHTLTAAQITAEPNVEVRRVMLERFGHDRYLREAGAHKLHTDDWGTLWRANLPDDEPLVMVEVLNSTPEPDGSFHTYFLRVHPQLRPLLPNGGFGDPQPLTARNAVASTFGRRGDHYQPVFQT